MVSNISEFDEAPAQPGEDLWGSGEVNILASSNWAWPQALRNIFQPRGVNLMMAENTNDFLNVIERRRIHTTIVDTDSQAGGLATIKVIRINYPLLPCIVLTSKCGRSVLGEALKLDVFGVIDKPVDMTVLQRLLNRLFVKKYNSGIFKE